MSACGRDADDRCLLPVQSCQRSIAPDCRHLIHNFANFRIDSGRNKCLAVMSSVGNARRIADFFRPLLSEKPPLASDWRTSGLPLTNRHRRMITDFNWV